MDKESTIQELNRDLVLPRTREDTFTITMEAIIPMEEVRITIVDPRMEMGMEEATAEPFQSSNARQEGSKSHYLFQVREEWTLRHRVF